jgi:hypothetical protein
MRAPKPNLFLTLPRRPTGKLMCILFRTHTHENIITTQAFESVIWKTDYFPCQLRMYSLSFEIALYIIIVFISYVCKIYIEILFRALRLPSFNYHYKDFNLIVRFVE